MDFSQFLGFCMVLQTILIQGWNSQDWWSKFNKHLTRAKKILATKEDNLRAFLNSSHDAFFAADELTATEITSQELEDLVTNSSCDEEEPLSSDLQIWETRPKVAIYYDSSFYIDITFF